MKYFYSFLLIAFLSINTSWAQTVHEINKLDREVELLLDTAAKHMVNFILTKEEAEYDMAMLKLNNADLLNETLIEKSATEKGLAGKIEKEIIEGRKEEIDSYKQASLKEDIINEKNGSYKKIKVKHKGKTYYLSNNSKKLYDLFSTYLPKN